MNLPSWGVTSVWAHEILKGECDCSKILLMHPSGEKSSVEVNSERISWYPAVVKSDCALCSLGCECAWTLIGEAMLSFWWWSSLSSDDVASIETLWKSWSGYESLANSSISEGLWFGASIIGELSLRYISRSLMRHCSTLSKLKGMSYSESILKIPSIRLENPNISIADTNAARPTSDDLCSKKLGMLSMYRDIISFVWFLIV